MEIVTTTPDEYLASLDDDIREVMVRLDELITAAMPNRRRVLWQGVFWGGTEQSIIGYGDITQPRPKSEDVNWFIVGLARQKANYSLYVNAVEDGAYLGKRYAGKLGKVKIGAASIGFTKLDGVDLDALTELMERAHQVSPPDP